jgi:hypothetical protein
MSEAYGGVASGGFDRRPKRNVSLNLSAEPQ